MDPVLKRIYSIKKSDLPDYARHVMLGGGTRGGPVLIKGKGCWVEDIDGRKYIDCTSQSWALYLGYANDQINAIVTEHLESLSHVHQGFDTLSRFAMARKLAEVLVAPVLLILAVLGSILGGVATPTEAASVGAVGALGIEIIYRTEPAMRAAAAT